MIDLQPFCSVDSFLEYLRLPFNIGDYTYATNGHILVRTARRADEGEANFKIAPKVPLLFDCHKGAKFSPFPSIAWPVLASTKQCPECKGAGKDRYADECFKCDGLGQVEAYETIAYLGLVWRAHYLRLIGNLPAPEFAIVSINSFDAAAFRFDGGVGALMPCRPGTVPDLGDLKRFAVTE